MKKTVLAAAALAVIGVSSAAIGAGQPDPATAAAIKARQAVMDLFAYNLGTLGAMAKGAIPYDAGRAGIAAENLATMTTIDTSSMWPKGSDNATVEGTRALPAIWEDMAGVGEKFEALKAAADEMAGAASMDLESLKAALGPVGAACGACHKAYRAPDN